MPRTMLPAAPFLKAIASGSFVASTTVPAPVGSSPTYSVCTRGVWIAHGAGGSMFDTGRDEDRARSVPLLSGRTCCRRIAVIAVGDVQRDESGGRAVIRGRQHTLCVVLRVSRHLRACRRR